MSVNVPRITSTLRSSGSPAVVIDSSIEEIIPITLIAAALSQIPFYSFDLQQTGTAPLNRALPELNTVRFS